MTASAAQPAVERPGEDDRAFRDRVARFATTIVRPQVAAMDAAAAMPRSLVDELFRAGLMGLEVARIHGGEERSFGDCIRAIETLASVDPAVAVVVDVQNLLVARPIARWGTGEQRRRHLAGLARDVVGAFALSEQNAGSDVAAMETVAEPDADGFVLRGRKLWITNAVHAGLFVVFANAAPARGMAGITAFLVEREAPGLTVGPAAATMGLRASAACELVLDGVRVPRDAVLGRVGAGYEIALESLTRGRIGIGAQMVGLASGALAIAVSYAKERRQFGQPIAQFQGVQFSLAEMATDVETARLLVYEAARRVDTGASWIQLLTPAAMAKLHAARVAERVASASIEVLGAVGFSRAGAVEKLYRDAKVGAIYEGTTNMQLRTIAATLLDGAV